MAQGRQFIVTHPSESVQGEGSYVKMRQLLYGDAKKLAKLVSSMTDDQKQEANDLLVINHVYEWNWLDDDGNPLPLPKDDPTVIDRLTAIEMQFLGKALRGDPNATS